MPNNDNIDERVVEMRIDNRQFVSGAEKTISILDKLKNALSFKNAGDGFNEVQRAANKVDLSGMADGVDKISSRFSDLGIVGMRVIQNLTDSVYGFVTRTVKGLTIDPVTGGFDKYEDILRKTQTIMSATLNEEIPERFATQLDYVSNQLELAAWYTDETSASLQDIVGNVSKFTNVGIGLEDAVWEMEGIANWGWSAGASMAEMGRAMYNLSQAMSVGSVKLMDWRSIENANMGTLEFKQTAIDTAVALGTLAKQADGTYKVIDANGKAMENTSVSAKNFNEDLSTGWFSSAVLEKTLKLYGEYSRRLGAIMDDTGFSDAGLSASDVIGAVDNIVEKLDSGEFKTLEEGLTDWRNTLKKSFSEEDLPSIDALRYSFELLSGDEDALAARAEALGESYSKLSEEQFELAKRAFLMGQEYKTFGDVIDATKDAVSTGWMKTFQLIIGNADEAKEVWTEVGDVFYGIFAEGAARRNAILKWWNSPGEGLESGRDAFLEAIGNIYRAVQSYIGPIIEGFDRIFSWGPAKEAGERLRELTQRFRDFTARLALSESAGRGMTNFFATMFGWIKKVLQVLKPVTSFFGGLLTATRDFFNLFFESFDTEAGKFDKDKFLAGLPGIFKGVSDNVKKAWTGIKNFFSSFSDVPIVRSAFDFIVKAIDSIISGGKDVIGFLTTAKDGLADAQSPVQKIKDWFSKIWDYVKNIKIDSGSLKDAFGKVGEVIQTVYSGLTGDEGDFKERIKAMLKSALQAVKETLGEIKLSDLFEGARLGIMGYTAIQFANFVTSFKKTADEFKSIPEAITGGIERVTKSFEKNQNANVMLKMAGAILMVAAAIAVLSLIPEDKFAAIAVTLAFFFTVLSKIAKSLSSTKNFADNKNNLIVKVLPDFAAGIIAVAILLGVAAAALLKLKDVSPGDLVKGFIAIIGVLIASVMLLSWLSKHVEEDTNVKALGKLIAIAAVINAVGKALQRMKELNPDQILAALFGITLVFLAVALVLYTAKDVDTGSGFGAFLVIIALVAVINGMIPAFLVLSRFSWKQFGIVILSIVIVMAAIAGLMFVISKVGSSGGLKGAVSLVVVAAALVLFAAALAIAAPAILTFGMAMIALMNALANTDNVLIKLALLAGLGVALIALGYGLQAVAIAAIEFAAAGLIISVACLAFAAGLALVTASIAVLTAVLIPFGSVLIDFCNMIAENGKVLVGVVSTVILAILTAILMSKMNIAYSVVAVILAVIQVIVQNGPKILEAFGQILTQILVFFVKMIPMLVNFLAATIVLIIDGIANSLRSNKAALTSAIENLFSVLLEIGVEVGTRLIGDILGAIVDYASNIPGLGTLLKALGFTDGRQISDGVASLGKSLSDSIYKSFGGEEREAREAAGGVVGAFADGLNDHNQELEDSTDLINGIATHVYDGADEGAETAGENAANAFSSSALDSIKPDVIGNSMNSLFGSVTKKIDASGQGETTGDNWMVGIGNGITNNSEWLNGIMGNAASSGMNAWLTNWGIASPSKVAEKLGLFWDLGIIKGIEGGSGDIDSASDTTAAKMTEAMQTAMTNMATLADEDFTISPVITPVVDMTNVEAGAKRASSLLNTESRLGSVATSADRTAANLGSIVRSMQNMIDARANTSNNTYNVSVYAQPGMDEEAVAYRVVDLLVRKEAGLG